MAIENKNSKYINYDVYGENVLSYQVISKKQFKGDVYIKGKKPHLFAILENTREINSL